jgi:hypothetical protein
MMFMGRGESVVVEFWPFDADSFFGGIGRLTISLKDTNRIEELLIRVGMAL